MRLLLAIVVGFSLIGAPCLAGAGDMADLENEKAKVNYSVGYQIGNDFKRQGVKINPEAMIKGIQDALSGKTSLMTAEEQRTTLVNLQRRVDAQQKPEDANNVQE
jgi:FKBP-type peptidyl-prolyl cis-trans isomerase FklB